MQNKKLIGFLEAIILMPMMTVSVSAGNIPKVNTDNVSPKIVLSQKNISANGLLAFNQVVDQKAEILKIKALAIDTYFKEHGMPLEGMGMKMVQEAEKNDIDWRLLPAISVRESTGGLHACKKVKFSFMGWGSCKINFKSNEESIEIVARNLGGNNPNTDHHYADKTTKQILQKYNPPSIVPHYAEQVIKIMDNIGDEIITLPTNT
ncbi:MAG: hypothetical protein WAV23_01820 [Minisyncoccia bacterium]